MTHDKPQHTPEPWEIHCGTTIENSGNQESADEITTAGGDATVAYVVSGDVDAKRIVACFNACAGIADPVDAIAKARDALSRAESALAVLTSDDSDYDADAHAIAAAIAALKPKA